MSSSFSAGFTVSKTRLTSPGRAPDPKCHWFWIGKHKLHAMLSCKMSATISSAALMFLSVAFWSPNCSETLDDQPSCLRFSGVGVIGMNHHIGL